MNKLEFKKETPLVCICVPTFNAERTIRETLASILNQKYKNLDIHIVDNASTDETLRIVSEFEDSRIKIHRNEVNVGGEGNFNRCIQLATGEYTAIFHADDIYEPEIVQLQIAFLERHTKAGAVFTEASLINEYGKIFRVFKFPKELSAADHLYEFGELIRAVLHVRNFFICSSAMVRTNIYQNEIKCWNGKVFKSSSDLDVWLRIAQCHLVGLLPIPLIRYRISSSQFSAQVRLQTDRADFYLVGDYYLVQPETRFFITDADRMHYRWLERTDRVRRALNLFNQDKSYEACQLCADVVTIDAFRAAFDGRLGLLTLLSGGFIKCFTLLRLQMVGKMLINYVRR